MIPHTRAGMFWRFLLAAIVIIGAAAATTAVAGLLQFKQIATDFSSQPAISDADVTLPAPSAPETLLLIGSDHRAGAPYRDANTDTMMLVRLNDASATINVLSIPRDLEVNIPGYGVGKINAAYQDGGTGLMIRTIKQNVFPNLRINHILDVNFSAFSDLVDAIGCVYSAVDERYYNNTALTNYSSIDIQPGYQKLCGDNQSVHGALPFVRFRHTDTDIVRNARQQDFLRWAKEQYSESELLANRNKLLRIFGENTQTDASLHTTDGLIDLFDLVINADGSTIKSIPFPYVLDPCTIVPAGQPQQPCYVSATSTAALQRAYTAFMSPTKAAASLAATTGAAKKAAASAHSVKGGAKLPPGLVADPADGIGQAKALGNPGLPVYYPRLIMRGSQYCSSLTGNCNDPQEPAYEYAQSYPRRYVIRDRQGAPHAAYYMTLVMNPLFGQYYGVQGTTWLHPPLLANPQATKVVDGKKLYLYAAGGRLTTVAWRTPNAVYWIQNTLASTIGNQQMVAIAASLSRAG